MKKVSLFGAVAACALLAACQGSMTDVDVDDSMQASSDAMMMDESSSSDAMMMDSSEDSMMMDASSSSDAMMMDASSSSVEAMDGAM